MNQKWFEFVIFTVFFISLFVVNFTEIFHQGYLLMILYIIIFGSRAYFEWKYARETKEHIMTLYSIPIGFLFFLVLMLSSDLLH
jgi:Domain of unknown function (DUF4181)